MTGLLPQFANKGSSRKVRKVGKDRQESTIKIDDVDAEVEPAQLPSLTADILTEQFIANPQNMADDNRVAMVLFGAIIGGAALALMTGYLVFFRDW